MKRIGYIDARRISLPDKIDIQSWGATLGEGYHQYFNDDYSCYIGSSATNVLMIGTAAGTIQFRCGPGGVTLAVSDKLISTAYTIRSTGMIDAENGKVRLPIKTAPVTRSEEGTIFYNTTTKKLNFCTDTAIEAVTSA